MGLKKIKLKKTACTDPNETVCFSFRDIPKTQQRQKEYTFDKKKKLFQISIMLITSNIMSNKRFVIELL